MTGSCWVCRAAANRWRRRRAGPCRRSSVRGLAQARRLISTLTAADATRVSSTNAQALADKTMNLRYAGTCRLCGAHLSAGERAVYERATRAVRCVVCPQGSLDPAAREVPDAADPPTIEPGTAGASAQREHDRRAARREERIRTAHPKVGGLILALSDEPQSTRAWSSGAVGEQVVARSLEKWTSEHVRLLHDRRVPRTRANIDHIAVGPTGVYVIDAKRYKGRPDLRVQGGILRPRIYTLTVGSRDCTKLVTGVRRQVDLITSALATSCSDVQVRGMLCFVDADWPVVGGSFSIDDVDVLWPKKAAQMLNRDGELTADQVDDIHRRLATAFPVA